MGHRQAVAIRQPLGAHSVQLGAVHQTVGELNSITNVTADRDPGDRPKRCGNRGATAQHHDSVTGMQEDAGRHLKSEDVLFSGHPHQQNRRF